MTRSANAPVATLVRRWAADSAAPAGLPALLDLCGADAIAVLDRDGEIQASLTRPGMSFTIDQADIDQVVFAADPGERVSAQPAPPARWAAAGISRTWVQLMPAEAGLVVVAWSTASSSDTSQRALRLALQVLGDCMARAQADHELAALPA